jgi:hypothetical protein
MKMTKQVLKLFLLIASFFVIGNTFAQTCPTGLVSYWRMDELSGTTLTDAAGGHNALCSSALARDLNGRVVYAQAFDTLKVATVSNHTDYNFGVNASFTYVYWMKFTEVLYGGQDHIIISKGDWSGGNPTSAFFGSGVNGQGYVNFLLSDATGHKEDLESTTSFNDGIWHQVACVRDESVNTSYLYVDGTVVASKNYDYTGNFTNSNSLLFGYLVSNSVPGYYYRGSLDEVAIYNRALSSTEINAQRTKAYPAEKGICDGLEPNITSIPNTKASVNGVYTYPVHAAGTKTGMKYYLLTNPSGMTISQTTGAIIWTPAAKDVNGLVVVRADNGTAPADTQTFRIYVTDEIVPPAGLITLHKLNETAGTVFADYFGLHNATASVPPTVTTGKIKLAQAFGSGTKMEMPDNGTEFDWDGTASFSFEYWMKTSASAKAMVCISRKSNDDPKAMYWFVGVDNSGYATMELHDNDAVNAPSILVGTTLVNDNVWHHIVGVRNGASNKTYLYVDGTEQANATISFSHTFSTTDPLPVSVGYFMRFDGGDEYHFVGALDEVAIYNKALTAAEVASYHTLLTGHCAEGNFAPAVTSTPVTTGKQDVAYSYTFATDDIDVSPADVLTLSAPTIPSWLTFNWTPGQKTATLTGTPHNGDVGITNVTLRVTDTHTPVNQTFTINVANVNDPPVITSAAPVTTGTEKVSYSHTFTVSDADVNDTITISKITLPGWLTFTYTPGAKTATISGIPGNDNTGIQPVLLRASDGHGGVVEESYNLNIAAVNDLPVITGQSALSVDEDHPITILKSNLTIVDPDNAAADLTLIVHAGTNYTFSGNTVTPAANFNGQLNVMAVVNDLSGSSAEYPIIVTVNPVNDAPVFTSTPIESATVGELYVFIVTATDVDNATLTLSATDIPSWLTFDAVSGVLSGAPAETDKGQYLVVMNVSDGTTNVDLIFSITTTGTGITEAKNNEFVIYPVPVSNALNIRFDNLAEETMVDIISSTGNIVESVMVPANTEKTSIPVQNMEPGLYICHVRNSTINNTSRFLIVR